MSLALLLATAQASPTSAALLHRRDMLGLCEELSSYCTPAVVITAQQLVAAVADRVPVAAEEIVQAGAVPALAAILLRSSNTAHRQQAADKLAALADTCSGDDFAALTATAPGATAAEAHTCAVYGAWQLLCASEGDTKSASKPSATNEAAATAASPSSTSSSQRSLPWLARRFLLRSCERAQRAQRLGSQVPPRGGCWDAIGRPKLQDLLRSEATKSPDQQQQGGEQTSFSQLKRGFFGSNGSKAKAAGSAKPVLPPRPPRAAGTGGSTSSSKAAAVAQPGRESHAYKQGAVVIEELEEPAAAAVPAAPSPAQTAQHLPAEANAASAQAVAAAQVQAAPEHEAALAHRLQQQQQQQEAAATQQEDEEIADLQDVYDSSTSLAAEQRRVRAEWLALPMDKKLRCGRLLVACVEVAGLGRHCVASAHPSLHLALLAHLPPSGGLRPAWMCRCTSSCRLAPAHQMCRCGAGGLVLESRRRWHWAPLYSTSLAVRCCVCHRPHSRDVDLQRRCAPLLD